MLNRRRLKIHPSIFIMVGIYIYMGKLHILGLIFLFVTIHELAHGIMAILLGAKLTEILITPIGERAVIKDIEVLPKAGRMLILGIGPIVSITMGMIFMLFFQSSQTMRFCAEINLTIGFFNLLPFLPLDGGRIALFMCESIFGTLRTAEFIVNISKWFGWILVILGIIQVILFPFNISLLLMGLYFRESNKMEYLNIAYGFYKNMLRVKNNGLERRLKIKGVYVSNELKLSQIVNMLSLDCFYLIYFVDNGKLVVHTQTEVLNKAVENGIYASVSSL